jgi:plastocyanin
LYTVNRAPEIVNAAAAASNPVTGTTTALSVLGADDGGEASLAYTWTATTAPSGATPIFSANGTNAAKNVNVTCNRAGAYTFQATIRDAGNLTATSSVTVTVNQTLTSVAVAPASVTLPLNGTQPLSATARDQFGVAMAAAFTWSSSGVGSVNTTGLYAAGAAPGSSTVMASTGGKSATASVNVVNTAPVVQTAASATPSTVTGTTTALAVLGADDGGEANLTYTWAATATPAGATPSFSANGTNAAKTTTVTFTKAGTYAFQATIRDQAGLSVTSSINVTVNQTLTSVAVAPTSATLPLNGTRQFTASATDQFGAPMTVPFAWSLSGVGSVSSSGLYAAGGVAGSATVTASAGGKSASASMTVVNTVPVVQTAASASPNPVNGTTTVLSVLGADDGGEANLTYTWSATAAPAGAAPSFSANGTNTAKSATVTFGQAGVYAFAVTIADQGGLTVASSVSVTVQQTLSALTIAPTSVSLPRDSSQQFIAAAADQFSIPMAVPLTWTCSGVGSVNDTGMYLSGRARGTATVTVSSGALSASASVTVRKSIAPVLASPAAATTDQAVVGQTLQFSAAPSAPDGNPLACAWDFGDGSPAVIGTVANHLYVTGGIYTVTFTAYDSSDPEAEVSASTLTIVVAEPSAGPDGASPPAPDSDGDGVSDLNETLDGTDPLDPDSFVAVPFEVTKLAGAFRVGEGGRDTCAISGRLPDIPAGFTPNGQVMVVDIAGAQATFTFTSKGRAKAVGGAAALKLTPAKRDPVTRKATFGGGALAFSAKLGKGSWAGVWALAGLDAAENRKNVPVTLPVLIRFAGKAYAATATVTFSASADKMGKFKSGFSGGRMGF